MTKSTERMRPLYEAKMIHHYDHRWATYESDGTVRDVTLEEKQDRDFLAHPRYWVESSVVNERLQGRWTRDWLLGWRDICRSTDERTMIAAIDGHRAAPDGGTLLALPDPFTGAPILLAVWNSFVFDFVARQKVGGTHLKYFTARQLPVPDPCTFDQTCPWQRALTIGGWLRQRVLALVADANDMIGFANDFASSIDDTAWKPDARALRRAELDAAMFQVFQVARDDVAYIMETFPIVKRKDIAAHGEYRTKRLILEIYDEMAQAIADGTAYVSRFDPQEEER